VKRLPPALAATATPKVVDLLGEGPGRVLELGFAGVHAAPLELVGWEVVVESRILRSGTALKRAPERWSRAPRAGSTRSWPPPART
jgi:hypothetical protein